MEKIIKTTKHHILISDKELENVRLEIGGINKIMESENFRHTTPTVENWTDWVFEIDKFNWTDWFKNYSENNDVCDVLLDHVNDDGRYRYRNYMNKDGIAFLYRHPRNSLRSIINSAEMYDKQKLYWYLI